MKKICIKGSEFNTNYHEVYGEEKAIADGYSVFEVPKGYEDCVFEDFDENGFNIEFYNARKKKEQNQHLLFEYKEWFKKYFEYQLTQSLWQINYSPSYDNYFNKYYANIEEVKAQAEIVRQEIKKLK